MNCELYEEENERSLTMVKQNHSASPCQRLDEVDALRIILLVNLFIVRKRSVLGCMFEVLEPSSVEGHRASFPRKFSTTTSLFTPP